MAPRSDHARIVQRSGNLVGAWTGAFLRFDGIELPVEASASGRFSGRRLNDPLSRLIHLRTGRARPKRGEQRLRGRAA
jgi:hypothetical protein